MIKPYTTDPQSPVETFLTQVAESQFKPNPLAFVTEDPQASPGWWRAASLSLQTNSIIGSTLTEVLPYHLAQAAAPSEVDPAWDVRKYNTDDFLSRHPFMVEDFLDGTADDFPNEARFLNYVERKRNDFEVRAELGQASIGKQLLTAIPGQMIDGVAGGLVLRAVGAGSAAAQLGKWATSGNWMARATKSATIGAVLGESQNAALAALNPSRNVDEGEEALWAIGMGAAFGLGASVLASGASKTGQVISTARVRRIEGAVAEAMKSPTTLEVTQQAASDAALLRDALDSHAGRMETIDGPPREAMGASEPFNFGGDAVGSDQSRSFTVLDTPETRPLMDELRAKYGDNVNFNPHPMQDAADWARELADLEATLKVAQPANLGKIGNAIANTFARGLPIAGLEAPGARLMRSPSLMARQAGRLFMDFAWPTQESIDAPLTHKVNPPAEGLKWQLNALRDEAHMGMEQALRDGLRDGPFEVVMSDGQRVSIRNRALDRDKFGRAVIDHLRAEDEFSRSQRTAPDAHPAVVKAGEALRAYWKRVGEQAVGAGFLSEIDPAAIYTSRRWLSDVIRRNSTDFKRRLVNAWERNRVREYVGGREINPDAREIIPEAVKFDQDNGPEGGLTTADRKAIGELMDVEAASTLTEEAIGRALGADVLGRYRREVSLYFEAAAESTFNTLTGLENAHGVEHGLGNANPFRSRSLRVNESDFTPYLEENAFRLLEAYDHQTSGRVAVRQAIKNDAETWAPIVHRLTGQDLAKSGYDPNLVLQAVRNDFQRWMNALQNDRAAQAKIEAAMKATVGERASILDAKLAELEGRPVFPGNPAASAGWRYVAERVALRLPYMAYLGKMPISAFNDLAALAFLKGLNPRRAAEIGKALNLFRELPLSQQQGLYVAMTDATRSLRAMELGDIGPSIDSSHFGPSFGGRALAAADSISEYMARKFTSLTGINRWNTNLKRMTASLVGDTIVQDARKMARAAAKMREGLSQAEAIQAVGLSQADAARMNRLGFNASRSRELLDMLFEHGVDHEGNRPWGLDRDAFDAHEGFVHPQLNEWYSKNKPLFDTWTNAVNSETMNIIVETKLASKPIATSSFLGKIVLQFQSFPQAWSFQQVPLAMQRPGYELAMYMGLAVGLGALTDAIHNQLSGRRSLGDTARLWEEKPAGMVYSAVTRGGLFGWMARPLGLLEQTPYGPGKMLGNDQMSSMYARPGPLIDQLGPFFSWANQNYSALSEAVARGGLTERGTRQLWNAAPFHNLWMVEGFNRAAEAMGYDTPIGPTPRPFQRDQP